MPLSFVFQRVRAMRECLAVMTRDGGLSKKVTLQVGASRVYHRARGGLRQGFRTLLDSLASNDKERIATAARSFAAYPQLFFRSGGGGKGRAVYVLKVRLQQFLEGSYKAVVTEWRVARCLRQGGCQRASREYGYPRLSRSAGGQARRRRVHQSCNELDQQQGQSADHAGSASANGSQALDRDGARLGAP